MNNEGLNASFKKENLRLLRRFLRQTQKEFITQFLTDENGKASISIATLSNLEARGGTRLNEVVLAVAGSLMIDPMVFSLPSEEFIQEIELLPGNTDSETVSQVGVKKGNIKHLLSQITMYFAEQLFDGKLKKGDKVESDRVLAEKLGVGRSAIREALKVLDVMGMIDIRPGQGTFISSNEENFFIIPLSWSLFLNGTQIDSIIAVRNVLEIKAAELAAACDKKESRSKLYDISHRIHNAYVEQNYKEFLEDDLKFHICVAECSGNQVIYSMIQTISNLMRRISGSGMVDAEQLREIYEEHQKIYGLILAHDGEGAARAMEEHLAKSIGRYHYR